VTCGKEIHAFRLVPPVFEGAVLESLRYGMV